MKPASPVIFCHFGNSPYLDLTLKQAYSVSTVDSRPVYLLGDCSTRSFQKIGIYHVLFADYIECELYLRFDKCFALIGGSEFLNSVNKQKTAASGVNVCWTRFNFIKWIALYNFLCRHSINSCWFFDSDILLLKRLAPLENSVKTESVDWTYWNHLHQQQGWVGLRALLKEFIEFYLSVFEDKSYLRHLEETTFKDNPRWGFTLMRAWDLFHRNSNSYKSVHLSSIGSTSPIVFAVNPSRSQFENLSVSSTNWISGTVVELFSNRQGSLYVYNLDHDYFSPVHMLDTSWMDSELYSLVRRLLRPRGAKMQNGLISIDQYRRPLILRLTAKVVAKLEAWIKHLR